MRVFERTNVDEFALGRGAEQRLGDTHSSEVGVGDDQYPAGLGGELADDSQRGSPWQSRCTALAMHINDNSRWVMKPPEDRTA